MTGDIQPEKNLAISGRSRSAFLGVKSREGELLTSAATVDTLGDTLEVLLDTQALDLMGACPLVLGRGVGVSTHVAVETGTGGGGPCTACEPSIHHNHPALMCRSPWDSDCLAWCPESRTAHKGPRNWCATRAICRWRAGLRVIRIHSQHEARHEQMAAAHLSCGLEGARIQDL
jgi:hypothetical protein